MPRPHDLPLGQLNTGGVTVAIGAYINGLVHYAIEQGLLDLEDRIFACNRLLEVMELDGPIEDVCAEAPLHTLLGALTENAVQRGLIGDTVDERDRFDTKLMGVLIPFPHEVRKTFRALYEESPQKATEWYYAFSKATNYIRTDRIARDEKWKYQGTYGTMDITINLSKPEKDPRTIVAVSKAKASGYPACVLCAENEGYAGRIGYSARQNHRAIPVKLGGCNWYFQYSPYVYYQEHCIAFSKEHYPMQINRETFRKLLDFVTLFPHYFMGSNAGLPIVGGSILSHDHFQGGRYDFAMAAAPIETPVQFAGFEDVTAGILYWPMSVLRLSAGDRERLVELADKILRAWQGYDDTEAMILSHTGDIPHNAVTPIARRKGEAYELDLVLRNNRTTEAHPLGLFHPHEELHHIKRENIGLIEVLGLAVLPPRLKKELRALAKALVRGEEILPNSELSKHAPWAKELQSQYAFTKDNVEEILKHEVGAVFERVLLDAGVFKRTEEGKRQFLRFVTMVNQEDAK